MMMVGKLDKQVVILILLVSFCSSERQTRIEISDGGGYRGFVIAISDTVEYDKSLVENIRVSIQLFPC